MEAQATNPTPAPQKVRETPYYDGNTFCDLAGCDDSTRLLVNKTFAGQTRTAAKWTSVLAEKGITATVVK